MDKTPEERREESLKIFGFDVSENLPNQKFFQPSGFDSKGTIYDTKFEPTGETIYGDAPALKQITISSHDGSDHVDRVKLAELPIFFHTRLVWAAENSGRKEFVSTLEHANTTLKGLGCVDERITKRLDELANDGRNCINDDEFSSTVQKVRSIFRELRLESKQG